MYLNAVNLENIHQQTSAIRLHLSVVGKISGVYRKTIPKEPVMPNFPIMLSVILSGVSDA